mgnify:FL=1
MYNQKTYLSEFLKELNEQLNEISDESETNKEDICLISMEKLEESHITLPCSHKFNYIPLYNEICEQKTKNNPLEVVKLHFNEIKCPYCRTITTGLLPYQCIDGVKKKCGVNYPLKHCLPIYKCEWVYKNGNLLGEKCNQKAGLYNNHCYCNKHINFINNKIKIEKCDSILVSGKRKGQRCGCKCFKDSKCKRHLKKIE